MTILIFAAIANNMMVAAAIAIVIGLVLFFWGLKSRRESLAVAQIPELPITSIAPGPVHVHGKAVGDDRLVSPFTGVPCYFYNTHVEKQVKQGDQVQWQTFKGENGQRDFYVDDGTGQALVDLQQAEFDLPTTLQAEIGINSAHYCKIDPALGIPRLSENQLHAVLISDWSQARAAVQSMGGSAAKAADKVLAVGEKMAEWGVSTTVGGVTVNPGLMGESFRIRETCLLADHEYSVIGTCEANAGAKDDRDRKIIRKGAGSSTFLISLKTGQQLVKSLQTRAIVVTVLGVLLVIAGVVLAVVKR